LVTRGLRTRAVERIDPVLVARGSQCAYTGVS
jgi:hypothetical protein